MSEMYYTREPSSASNPVQTGFTYRGHALRFTTDAGVFSRGELDNGTELLLDCLPELTGDVLDLGCGWGPVGVSVGAANPGCRVTMVDVNLRALSLSKRNAEANSVHAECLESNGYSALVRRSFDAVITNPPIRAGKAVIYGLFADTAKHLKANGALYIVIRKQQGAESAIKYLRTLYADVETIKKGGGFWVIRAASPIPEEHA